MIDLVAAALGLFAYFVLPALPLNQQANSFNQQTEDIQFLINELRLD